MKILFTGNIDNIAYSCAKFARRKGVDADVLISSVEKEVSHPFWEDPEDVASPIMRSFERRGGLQVFNSLFQMRKIFDEYDIVISMGMMSIAAHLLKSPYIAIALGADMKELVFEKTPRGWLMDRAFRYATQLYYNDTDHIPAVSQKGYNQARYFPIPVDTEKYLPKNQKPNDESLLLFHGSSLSWTLDWTKKKELHKTTLKRNDVFFKGLHQYINSDKSRVPVEVVVPLWGPDKDNVKPLCEKLGILHLIKFVPPVNKSEIIDLYHRADVVIDQFNMPRLGYNALEALSCGRPVLGYYTEELQLACYPELPPMLSANSPEVVVEHLIDLQDSSYRVEKGKEGRNWILNNHHWDPIISSLLNECSELV